MDFVVLYTIPKKFNVPTGWHIVANDSDDAENKLLKKYPDADVTWIVETASIERAFEVYHVESTMEECQELLMKKSLLLVPDKDNSFTKSLSSVVLSQCHNYDREKAAEALLPHLKKEKPDLVSVSIVFIDPIDLEGRGPGAADTMIDLTYSGNYSAQYEAFSDLVVLA